jgi:hypothetical protein
MNERLHRHRQPDFRRGADLQAEKPPRRDADDRGRGAVDDQPPADHGRIGVKTIRPRRPAQDRHRCAAGSEHVVMRIDQPADRRRQAEHREVVADDVLAVDRVGVDAVRAKVEPGR